MSATTIAALALGLALVAGACTSTGGDRGGGDPSRVERTAPPLSEEQHALLGAYDQDGTAWEAAREAALADPDLLAFLVDQLILRMVRAFEGMSGPRAAARSAEFDRAQAELVRLGAASTPMLVGLVALGDGVVASLATDTLERIGRPAVQPVARLLLSEPAPVRRRAAEALARLPHAGGDEDAVRAGLELLLRKDPDWVVRAQVAQAMGSRGSRDRTTEPWRRALERALSDPDPVVVGAVAEGLARLGDPLAVPALIASLAAAAQRGDLSSVQALQQSLRALTGEAGTGGLDGWRRWWFEHRDELQRAAASR